MATVKINERGLTLFSQNSDLEKVINGKKKSQNSFFFSYSGPYLLL